MTGAPNFGTKAAGLRLEIITTDTGLDAIAPEWETLLRQLPRPSPFLGWEWVATWRRHFGGGSSLSVAVARSRGGELVGVAPLHVASRRRFGIRLRSLEFLGYRGSRVCADHLDFLAAPDLAYEVTQALCAELLRQRRSWDVVVLAGLAEDSLVPRAWAQAQAASAAAITVETEEAEICPFLPLSAGPDGATRLWQDVRARHPQFAANVVRYRRRLQRRYQVEFQVAQTSAEVETAFGALIVLHRKARQRHHGTGAFDEPAYLAFHRDLVARLGLGGELYLAQLSCDGVIAAVFYGFFRGQVLYFYQSGYDTARQSEGVGKLLLAYVLEDAATRLGAREFDFLRGEEAYKSVWTEHTRRNRDLRVWRRDSAAARLDAAASKLRARARRWRRDRRARPAQPGAPK